MNNRSNSIKWTDIQTYCYDRNCICSDCFFKQYNEGDCNVKTSIMEKILKFGLKKGVKTKQWLQE